MTVITDNFNGFTINIFQDEEGDWIAHLVEMPNVSAFAQTPQEALNELTLAWQGVKESYRKHGEYLPYLTSTKIK
ncbi:MAG: type II toxin-antitoxin system HicB family antitoxin [Crocosphaera sp.]